MTQRLRSRRCAALAALAGASALAQVQITQPPTPADEGGRKGGHLLQDDAAAPAALAAAAPLSPEVQAGLRQINGYRSAGASCGTRRFEPAPPLSWSETLERAASAHAHDMASRRVMSHTGSDGSAVNQRMERVGYAWAAAGENVSAGYKTMAEALVGWLNSPGHCANMMSPSFQEVGVAGAYTAADTFGWYRTMVLGRPRGGAQRPGAAISDAAPSDLQGRDAQGLLEAINRRRRSGGNCGGTPMPPAPPLAWDERIERVAELQAEDMARRRTPGRPPVDTLSLGERLTRAGFAWSGVGEISGFGHDSAAAAVQAWLADAGQCEWLLGTRYSHLALAGAAAEPAGGNPLWVMILARP